MDVLSEAGPAADRRRIPATALILLLLAALWCIVWFLHARGYWEDDAYIHLEFARSVAEGHGFAFNGTVVYGDTSPLWVWLLVGFHHLIPGWLTAGKTLVALAAVLSLAGAFFFARSLTLDLPRSRSFTFAAAMVLLFATNPYFGYWAYSGMEPLAAAGLVCWACVAIAPAQLSTRRFLLSAFLAGIAPLLRPEMGFFTVLLGLVLLDRLVKKPAPITRRVAELIAGLLLIAAPGIAWGLYALHTFGRILPNTDAAKRAGPGESVMVRLFDVYGLGFPLVLIGVALLIVWLVIRYSRGKGSVAGPRLIPLLHAGGWIIFLWTAISCIFYIANHTYVQTRYIFVSAPILTIALLALALKLSPRLYRAGLIFGLLFGIAISLDATWPLIHNKVGIDRGYAALAAFFDTLPPNAPVAHYSIGEAAFLSRHPLVDTGGITRPGIIPYMWDPTDARRLAWIHSQGARYIVIDHQPEPGATLVWYRQIPTSGWFLNRHRYAERDTLEVWKLP
ncbi:MAG TPA: hypothetical protein VHY48_01040 [Acidobacteriaceae bacterium]|nr:hypothetical protein [Acidobacteriaceae bacterium]